MLSGLKPLTRDLSAPFRVRRRSNPQNDGLWIDKEADKKSEGVKMVVNEGFDEHSKGLMLFGGICADGSLPWRKLIFFTEWLNEKYIEIGKEKNTLNNVIHAQFIKEEFVTVLERDLDGD